MPRLDKLLIDPKSIKMSHNECIGYAAGLIDGEGYIGISLSSRKKYPSYSLTIKVGMTTTRGIGMLQLLFNGNTYLRIAPASGRAVCTWEVSTREDVRVCLIALQNKILIKKPQVDLGLKFLSLDLDRELRHAFYLKFKALNSGASYESV